MATEKLLSQTKTAHRLRISTSWLRVLTARGEVRRSDDGTYPWPQAGEDYAAYRKRLAGEEGASKRTEEFEEARARREMARARMAELEVGQREGSLIPRDAVEEVYGRMLDLVRSRLLNAPGRWASQIVGLESPRAGQAALRGIVDEILDELNGPVADDFE